MFLFRQYTVVDVEVDGTLLIYNWRPVLTEVSGQGEHRTSRVSKEILSVYLDFFGRYRIRPVVGGAKCQPN